MVLDMITGVIIFTFGILIGAALYKVGSENIGSGIIKRHHHGIQFSSRLKAFQGVFKQIE